MERVCSQDVRILLRYIAGSYWTMLSHTDVPNSLSWMNPILYSSHHSLPEKTQVCFLRLPYNSFIVCHCFLWKAGGGRVACWKPPPPPPPRTGNQEAWHIPAPEPRARHLATFASESFSVKWDISICPGFLSGLLVKIQISERMHMETLCKLSGCSADGGDVTVSWNYSSNKDPIGR